MATSPANSKDVILGLQYVLKASGIPVKPDGVWGPKSKMAFESADPSYKTAIQGVAQTAGVDLSKVTGGEVLSLKQVESWITEVSNETRVPQSYLNLLVRHESEVTSYGVIVKDGSTGTYRGIAQFGPSAWNELMPGVPHAVASTDHRMALLAAAKYYLQNRDAFYAQIAKDKLMPQVFTDAIAYLYHNQGANGGKKALVTKRLPSPKQSVAAISLFRQNNLIA